MAHVTNICPECGAPIAVDAPAGLCVACLLRLALAGDLDHWLRREPILARPAGPFEHAWKWVRRHPAKAAVLGASALAVALPLVLAYHFYSAILPEQARAHPIVGRDHNVNGFLVTFETGTVDRATMNFDNWAFRKRPRQAALYFTNIPPAALPWVSSLRCRVMADLILSTDEPRSPVLQHGDSFTISQARRRDRAYYVAPLGWKSEEVLARAPNARIWITGIGNE